MALRGQPGWGENMATIDTMANSFGATWFDMSWHPTLDTPEWKTAVSTYLNLVKNYGPPGVTANGFNENLTLFASGKAAMWIDATSLAGPLYDKTQSQVADKVAFANAPIAVTPNGSHWLWSWVFAIPQKAKTPDEAEKFALWATSKEYVKLVADEALQAADGDRLHLGVDDALRLALRLLRADAAADGREGVRLADDGGRAVEVAHQEVADEARDVDLHRAAARPAGPTTPRRPASAPCGCLWPGPGSGGRPPASPGTARSARSR